MFDVITYSLCKKLIKDAGKIFSLKGTVTSVNELPLTNNNIGDVYLVGPKSDGSFDEYYWNDAYGWDPIGNTGIEMDGYINDITLYKGADGTGTIDNPAEDTIIYTLNNIYAKQEDIMENYVKFTDYATSSKAGILKSRPSHNFNIDIDGNPYAGNSTIEEYKTQADSTFLSKGTIENIKNNYVKEALQSDEVKEELITQGFVKNTDYATPQRAGLVRTQSNLGIQIGTLGQISVNTANNAEIENKTQQYKPITPSNLDYAVKTSLTTNTIELTDEEKTNAQNWIGITDLVNKVDKKTIDTKNELERVKNDILETGTDTDTFVHLEDSAMAELQELSIDGVCEQETTTGANLCDLNVTQNNKVVYNSDGTIKINGSGGFALAFKQFTVKENTKYYTKWELVSGTVDTSKSNGNSFLNPFDNTNLKKDEFKESVVKNDKNISGFWINNMAVFTNAVIRIWFSKTQSPFEKYTGGQPSPNPDYPQEIKTIENNLSVTSCNKNLLALPNKTIISNGITSTIKNNELTIKGTCTQSWFKISGNLNLHLKAGTYTLSRTTKDAYRYNFEVTLASGTNKTIYGSADYNTTFTIDEDFIINTLVSDTNIVGTSFDFKDYVQLEPGSQATSFEEHLQSQIEANLPEGEFIGKIDDTYKDTLKVEYNEEDGEYHLMLYKMLKKYTFTGNENIALNSTSSEYIEFIISNLSLNPSNFLPTVSNYFLYNLNNRIAISNSGIYIRVPVECEIDTVDKIKTFLLSNEVYVYYVLATPYILDLGIVDMPLTYDEVTNLFTDSNLMPTINAKYYRNFISTVRNLQVNEKSLKQELIDINNRLSALESATTNVASESEVVE